jgi:hypothetical protein
MGIHENTEDLTGSVVFFTSYGDSLNARFAAWSVRTFTHGPYVHVGFIINPRGQVIQATSRGIVIENLPPQRKISIDSGKSMGLYQICDVRTKNVDMHGNAHPIEPDRMAYALAWALEHEKVPYSWLDIVDQGFDVVAPWNRIHVVEADHFDCSNFTVAFLDKMGIPLPANFTYPWNVSPNDLAEWFGLLPMRGRIIAKKN